MGHAIDHKGEMDMGAVEKVLLFMLAAQVLCLPEYIRDVLVLNVGWGNIYPLRLYTIGFPAIYVLHLCHRRGRIRFPHLGIFLLLFGAFVFLESLPIRSGESSFSFLDVVPFSAVLLPAREIPYSFALEQFHLYVIFLLLVNFGLSRARFYRVIDYAFYAGLVTCAFTYAGYLGLMNLGSDYVFQYAGFTERPSTMVNANQISYVCAFAILLLIVKQLNERKFAFRYVMRDTTVISALFIMTVINASRGAFIIALILIGYYCYMLWRYSVSTNKSLLLFAIVMILTTGLVRNFQHRIFTGEPYRQTYLYQRFFELPDETTGNRLRKLNILNTLDNIREHPFLGVGYWNAARTETRYGTRSNNQFLHMLAACGMFFFALYLLYGFRLLAVNRTALKRPEVMLSLVFQVNFLMVVKPGTLALISISAYMAMYFYHESRERASAPARAAANKWATGGNENLVGAEAQTLQTGVHIDTGRAP